MGSDNNKNYTDKIKEKDYQIEFQKMILDIAFEFMSLNQENYNDKVDNLLEKVGEFFCVDRTYIFALNHKNKTMTYSNEWCSPGINPEVCTIEEMPLEVFPWWLGQLDKHKLVYIADVNLMPAEAKEEQIQLHRQDVKSLISVPIMLDGKIQAFIGIDSVRTIKKWSGENIELLHTMANILSRGMTQIKSDKKIKFMAFYDELTKLPNQFLFEDRVIEAIKSAKRTGKYISVVCIDLDNFKYVNDTIGRNGGDLLLKHIAKSLVGIIRKTDTVSRFTGDQFLILLNHLSDIKDVNKIMEKIMEIFLEPVIVNGYELLVTASAGIAIYPVDGQDSETLVKNADIAMDNAKSKGKNQYALCTNDMKAEMQTSIEISNDLYGALDRNELVVYYQPQIDLLTGEITGVEALLRWLHPTRGIIPPGVFIPIAEKNSLIYGIGEWVLRQSCIQNKKWQDMGLPKINMSVNLSSLQIINPTIVENIQMIIEETGLEPKYVELEITEGISISNTDHVLNFLNKLKSTGVSIAIDDFGTEYSSLSRLKWLPVDRIKIDMQFVQGIETDEKDRAIIEVIINLAKSLGLNVLAEGVETKEQLEFLKQKKCDHVQGYYYYKPMPANEIEKILLDLSRISLLKFHK